MKLGMICKNILFNNLRVGDVLGHSNLNLDEYQNWVISSIEGNIIKVVNKVYGKGHIRRIDLTIDGKGYRKLPSKKY